MTRIGFISDMHLGYSRGKKVNAEGVNQREADVYEAAWNAVINLREAEVDVIIDLGDMAHVPNPKKRAILYLISLVRMAGVPYFSANGNHTLQRSSSDLHLYDVISAYAPNFRGITSPRYITDLRCLFIPYGTSDEITAALSDRHPDTDIIAGHWACDDVPFPGDHVRVDDLPEIPVFLGHYHTRNLINKPTPVYIGSTERFAWGEWKNPTGVAVYDTEDRMLEFINHETRRWHDIVVNPDTYLGDYYDEIEGDILRVSIEATPDEYASLDLVALRKRLAPALEYQIRRIGEKRTPETTVATSLSLIEGWESHIKSAKLPKGASRKEVKKIGEAALA